MRGMDALVNKNEFCANEEVEEEETGVEVSQPEDENP